MWWHVAVHCVCVHVYKVWKTVLVLACVHACICAHTKTKEYLGQKVSRKKMICDLWVSGGIITLVPIYPETCAIRMHNYIRT